MVEAPPSAVFLLSRFDEAPGDGCEDRLLSHARGLGANRLYVDRAQPCSGAAYMVRDPKPEGRSDGAAQRSDPSVAGWAVQWVRAHRKLPPSLSPAQAASLCVVVQFEVSPMRRMWNVRGQPIESSGNQDFDTAVLAALDLAIDQHQTVPAPPSDLVGEHIEYRVEIGDGCRQGRPKR
jgi:hypothetical protein